MRAASIRSPAVVRSLTIERFRGIQKLTWLPAPGLNIILGGGDVGKSTILDALALLFSPSTNSNLTDTDYFGRRVGDGFSIEAVVTMPDRAEISTQSKLAWPWEWDGEKPAVVDADEESEQSANDPVYRVRVRGTEGLDLAYEIVQPDEVTIDHFNVTIRRAIGLVRLSGDDRNDRDLRLVYGSALERLLADRTLRSRFGVRLASSSVENDLTEDAKDSLTELDRVFTKKALPHNLSLGLTTPHGVSISALIGLTALKEDVQLPFSSWGSGTRRLAALEIASMHQEGHPLVIIDEIERGLEPYRQRRIIIDLQSGGSQVFLTTHSPVVLRAAASAKFWYLAADGKLGCVERGAEAHRKRDPEAYLARLAIIAEGSTEVGFVRALLGRFLSQDSIDLGIVVSDGGGNDDTLQILEALSATGLQFAGFADNEGRDPTRWATLRQHLGDLLFRWPSGCIESNIVALVPDANLEEFIAAPNRGTGDRLRTLADRLGVDDKSFVNLCATVPDLRQLIVQASTGSIPNHVQLDDGTKKTWKRHADCWFKSLDGGRELADKVFALGLWPMLQPQVEPFIRAVARAVTDDRQLAPPVR